MCYFDLIKHFGDVPYGYENSYVDDYEITSRFAIYDKLIEAVKAVEPYMYKVGEGGINGQRISRTFANAPLVRWLFMPVAIKLSVRICLNFMEKYSLKSLELCKT